MMVVRTLFLAGCFFLFSSCGFLSFAADRDESRAQLEQVKARIEKAEQDLKNKRKVELDISRELALLKRSLENIEARLVGFEKDQAALQKKISVQKKSIRTSETRVGKSRSLLENRLVALYKEGDTGPLRVLFSAVTPTEMVQQYQYLSRVLERDVTLLDDYRSALRQQKVRLHELEQLEQEKEELLLKEQQQHNNAASARELQSRLLARATADQDRLRNQLKDLKEKEKSLKELVKRLTEQAAAAKSAPESGPVATDFAVGRGKLGWPVQGRVIIGFGTQKDDKLGTYYESNGIEIATPPGSPVRVVAGGKIVFADYFKGYGNLVIVSHPGGYHTLYAQMDRMQKNKGKSVSAGDLLGYSGLGGRESIYFEIRKEGSPVNPLSWLKRS